MLKNALRILFQLEITPILIFGLIIAIWEKTLAGIILAIAIASIFLIMVLKSAKKAGSESLLPSPKLGFFIPQKARKTLKSSLDFYPAKS